MGTATRTKALRPCLPLLGAVALLACGASPAPVAPVPASGTEASGHVACPEGATWNASMKACSVNVVINCPGGTHFEAGTGCVAEVATAAGGPAAASVAVVAVAPAAAGAAPPGMALIPA